MNESGAAGGRAHGGRDGEAAARLLVVEDDRMIADAIAARLASEGHRVDAVHDGLSAVNAARRVRYDVIVLDVMLPGLDGLEVCRRVQREYPVPVLMLTARAEEVDRLAGLAVGADDYLTKPFSPRELSARVAALLRRVQRAARIAAAAAAQQCTVWDVGAVRVDGGARRVAVDGEQVHLTPTEFDLVRSLARRGGQAVSRETLLAEVWDWEPGAAAVAGSAARAIDSHVKALRRKLGPERIRTVTGVGYCLEAVGEPAAQERP
ncbi:MAG: response regulator transcription factor [Kineosporiaceae bacterium]